MQNYLKFTHLGRNASIEIFKCHTFTLTLNVHLDLYFQYAVCTCTRAVYHLMFGCIRTVMTQHHSAVVLFHWTAVQETL